ncbi:DMT family transporter [Microbacterium sp. C7(2022)]|uniref:DMT family transporter n=1 Tax=Microbacterium sp. C7(2022) TaxID=2992759 RepID=UPI00237AC967|nr:DMT family transporter [Microbacterium sp. C7(2022)]MDE0547122.1 DMT family transporter [Microbacterium sp. C7(2022)]
MSEPTRPLSGGSAPEDAERHLPRWIALLGAAAVGVLTATQARMNGALGLAMGDGMTAAFISFSSGLAILVVLSAVLPVGRRGVRTLVTGVGARRIPWWMLLGGVAGALTVATQGLAVGVIGVAMFTVGMVAGQTVCGLVLDRTGYGPAGVVAVTLPRLVGGALALAAVGSALIGDSAQGIPMWMLVLPFLAGAGIAWQQATNGRLRQRVGTPLTATLVNFLGGTVVLALGAAVNLALTGGPRAVPAELWMYAGGAVGVTYIFLSAALVPHTGVLVLGLGAVAGQLVTAIVIDAFWPTQSSPPLVVQFTMVTIALSSVLVASVRSPRRHWRVRKRR